MEKIKTSQNPYNYICENRLKKAIVAVLNKPRTVSEITGDVIKRLDLKGKQKIGKTLKEFEQCKIIRCLTSKLKSGKPGQVYGLTKIGVQIGQRIYREIGEQFKYNKLNNVNWYAYGWCLTGTQKKTVLNVLTEEPLTQREIRKKMGEFYRTRNFRRGKSSATFVARGNINDILQKMVRKGVVTVDIETKNIKRPVRRYFLTKKGQQIKRQMLV